MRQKPLQTSTLLQSLFISLILWQNLQISQCRTVHLFLQGLNSILIPWPLFLEIEGSARKLTKTHQITSHLLSVVVLLQDRGTSAQLPLLVTIIIKVKAIHLTKGCMAHHCPTTLLVHGEVRLERSVRPHNNLEHLHTVAHLATVLPPTPALVIILPTLLCLVVTLPTLILEGDLDQVQVP